MVATTVTPLIVRVVLRLKMGNKILVSWGVKAAIKSALDGIDAKWYFAATFIFSLFASSCVGLGIVSSASMISRKAFLLSKDVTRISVYYSNK
jgi:hypothetical protein